MPEPEPEPEPRADPASLAPDASGIDFRMALVASISLDLPSQHPSVVLREIDTPRRQLTFSIGMPDAVALSHAQRRIPTPRPLSHELLSDVLQSFDRLARSLVGFGNVLNLEFGRWRIVEFVV